MRKMAINNLIEENKQFQLKLRQLINYLKIYNQLHQCQQYIDQNKEEEKFILIVSNQWAKQLIPCVYHLQQIIHIYIYDTDKDKNAEEWANKFDK
ncbi:unnamed protein product, partial [Didymodactylos carnosus]